MKALRSPPRGADGKVLAVGTGPDDPERIDPAPLLPRGDQAIDRAERPCASCGASFQPTLRRRMLCLRCYRGGEAG